MRKESSGIHTNTAMGTNMLTMDLNLIRRLEENKDLAAKKDKILQEKEERLKKEITFQESQHLSVHQLTLEDKVKNFSKSDRWTLHYLVKRILLLLLVDSFIFSPLK